MYPGIHYIVLDLGAEVYINTSGYNPLNSGKWIPQPRPQRTISASSPHGDRIPIAQFTMLILGDIAIQSGRMVGD